jgi:hypothetical protein
MNIKTSAVVCLALGMLGTVAFGQTVQITGTVSAVTSTQITLQSGTDVWTIKRDATTTVTSGNLTVGSTVTVKCASVDAHKNEQPTSGPTATPAS